MKNNDPYLIIPITFLVCAGLVTILSFSGTESWFAINQNFLRQVMYVLVGILAARILSKYDPKWISHSGIVSSLFVGSLLLLGLVAMVGDRVNGARSWFNFGFFSLQPADFVKISFVALLSKYLSKRHVLLGHIKHFFVTAVYCALPVGLIFLQPDLGTALVFMGIWLGMVLVAGLSRRFVLALLIATVIVVGSSWAFLLKPYQKERIISFVDPLHDISGSGYNAYQSVVAAGSGGLLGRGLGFGTQSRLEYLPVHNSDFIVASFLEEWGFVGALILCISVATLLGRIVWYARRSRSNFEALFLIGFVMWIGVHSMIHIGMNIGLLPVTGLPMPFMSLGGSHIVAEFVMLGIVMAMISHYTTDSDRTAHKQDFTSLTEF